MSSAAAHQAMLLCSLAICGQWGSTNDDADIWSELTSPLDIPRGTPQPVSTMNSLCSYILGHWKSKQFQHCVMGNCLQTNP